LKYSEPRYLEKDIDLLLDILELEGEEWKLSVVNRMLEELCRMERIINPSWYWSEEFLGIKYENQ
jgi:hypothetical protein